MVRAGGCEQQLNPPTNHSHPYILALAAPLVATWLYYASTASPAVVMKEKTAWLIVGRLCGAWLALFSLFLLLIIPSHRQSFFSAETSRDWVCSYFTKENATHATRMEIHTLRRAKWKSIRPAVKTWTLANWSRLKSEKPDWFTPALIAQVDDDMIPDDDLAALGGSDRRKSSLGDRLLGEKNKKKKKSSNAAQVAPKI